MRVAVCLTPSGCAPGARDTAVVIDVLRATTTLTTAFANGARAVIPAATVPEAHALRDRKPGALLCGERDGRKIEGFDLGNSPAEYDAVTVAGRTLVFASTNGSQAMRSARGARRTLLGAFVNVSAVIRVLGDDVSVMLVCAGKLGRFCLEDAACAGLLCVRLAERGATLAGPEARAVATIAPRNAGEVRALVESAAHARYLRTLGPAFAADVICSATLDAFDRADAV